MASQKSFYEFTIQLNGIHFHIRASQDTPSVGETVHQMAHLHYARELHYVYDGEIQLRVPDGEAPLRLRAGQLCLIPDNLVHSLDGDNVTRFCFKFLPEFQANTDQSQLSEYLKLESAFSEAGRVMIFDDRHLSAKMEQFRALSAEKSGYTHQQQGLLLTGVILRVCELLQRHSQKPSKKERHAEQQGAVSRKWIIEEHIAGDYNTESIGALAQKLYLSERQTRAVVQSLMGENYKKLITRRRMEIANLLISSSQSSLTDIAYQIGYRSYNGFYSAYTQYYGLSPEEARRNVLREKEALDPLAQKVEAPLSK